MATLIGRMMASKIENTNNEKGDVGAFREESSTKKEIGAGSKVVVIGENSQILSQVVSTENPHSYLSRDLAAAPQNHQYPQLNRPNTTSTAGALQGSLHISSPADDSPGTPLLTDSSTMSLQEMFDHQDFVPQNNLTSEETHQSGSDDYNNSTRNMEGPYFHEDGVFSDEDEHPSFTPPLSLYSGTKYEPTTPIPESSNPSSLASSGRNTPVSLGTGILSNGDHQAGSVSSNTTTSAPRNHKPILYSAIGSLESVSASSYGDMKKRVGPRRDFWKLGAPQAKVPGVLLAPVIIGAEASNKDDVSRTLLAVQSQDLLSQEQQNRVSFRSNGSSRATPTASNRKPSIDKNETSSSTLPSQPKVTQKTAAGRPSNLRTSKSRSSNKNGKPRKKVSLEKPVEMFRPSCDAFTPRIEKKRIEYRKAEMRTSVQQMASMGTLSRPNFRDALRRVAMIIHQHIVKIEGRFEREEKGNGDQGLFKKSMRDMFSEDNYCTPTYKCTMVRIPMARPGMVYGLRRIKNKTKIPSEEEIYEFAHQLFKAVQLSSECSIVCLIYVERLMEAAKVPLLANTWRPIFMCGLLLASKVWQDLSSWNIEFASVYPQYSLEAINKLELNFLRNVRWDLYISTSLYAKYYFALRSLVEKVDFRQRYNRMVGAVNRVAQSEALKISKRTEQFKEETISQMSRSM